MGIHLTEDFSLKLVEAVRRNEIDVALAYNVGASEGVTILPILRESFVLISRFDEAAPASRDVPLKDTLQHKLVFHESYFFVRKALEDASLTHGIPLDVAFVAQSSEALFDAVETGLASAIVLYGMMEKSGPLGAGYGTAHCRSDDHTATPPCSFCAPTSSATEPLINLPKGCAVE